MQMLQTQFIEFAQKYDVLRFGKFQLKSGRESPYFFNAGKFSDGFALRELGRYYATLIQEAQFEFDVLFGPAYKGIPLATSISIALMEKYNRNVSVCFNRKEKKDHGEGGNLIGAPLKGRVLIVDDVITAGTAIRESMEQISQHEAQLSGIVLALDRQERGQHKLSAIQEIEQQYDTKVASLICFSDLQTYLADQKSDLELNAAMEKYRKEYGITAVT